MLSVVLAPDEDVEWLWTVTPDGAEYVSGYTIVTKKVNVDRKGIVAN